MSGICITVGAEDTAPRAHRLAMSMASFGQKTAVLEPAPGIALGRSFHGRLPGDRPPEPGKEGVTVVLDGEIFDETGPLADSAKAIRDLYRQNRLDEVAHLNGSFAAIIVDLPQRRVVLVTDRLGSRTLFVWQEGKRLAAASRLRALLADERVPRRLSVQGLVELLSLQRTVADHTQYADVRAMPAAQVWTFENGGLTRRQTRRLAWTRPDFDEREGAVRLVGALRRAAARRTADPVRHGILLSGGLDGRLVLSAARAAGRTPGCATAGAWRNQEIEIAESTAKTAGAGFRFYENPPAEIARNFDAAVVACDGLFPAPTNLFGVLPAMARDFDVLHSGHGLDYTLRGYYLPCRTIKIAGSRTRLPFLRPVPDGSPATVVENLRVGIKPEVVETALLPEIQAEVDERLTNAMAAAQELVEIEDPYNAWDAFILHCLGRHYAYSDFVAMTSVIEHRAVAFDSEVFDIYLAMPPKWRASGRMAQAAMTNLGSDLMNLPDANSGFRASIPFRMQIPLLFARGALRRLGLLHRPAAPDPVMSHGSWLNYPELFRSDPAIIERLRELPRNGALMDTGLFDPGGLAELVEQHLSRRYNHVKFLHQCLSLAVWLGQHEYTSVSHDG